MAWAGARALTGYLGGVLYGVEPGDPASAVVTVTTFLVAAVLAALPPALRARAADPISVLRGD